MFPEMSSSAENLNQRNESTEWILVTGFGPFAHHKSNPSWEAARRLPKAINVCRVQSNSEELAKPHFVQLHCIQLPVAYRYLDQLYDALSRHWHSTCHPWTLGTEMNQDVFNVVSKLPSTPPLFIVHCGVAGGSHDIRLEQYAYNAAFGEDVEKYVPFRHFICARDRLDQRRLTSLSSFSKVPGILYSFRLAPSFCMSASRME
jgi:hypothetical protein